MDEARVFSVSDFLDYINDFLVEERAVVAGEVSDCSIHPSGIYFSLKDEEDESLLQCYLSPFAYRQMGVELENGLTVKASGWPEIYKPRGKFSFKVQSLELSGEGTLRKAYEALKKKLEAEGLFEQKRPLPQFIERIGIITSKTGAVIADFRNNLAPLGCKLFLCDTRVEGAKAVEGIVRGLEYFNAAALNLDAIVVIRGGGSLEELQAFNNERVARALYASKIPTICGIGHDRDAPIASLVADHQTSTPSIAATLINNSWSPLRTDLPLLSSRLIHASEVLFEAKRDLLLKARTTFTNALTTMFRSYRDSASRLVRAAEDAIMRTKRKVEEYGRYIAAASPERNLRLGYSIIFDSAGRVVKDANVVKPGARIRARVNKGELEASVESISDKS